MKYLDTTLRDGAQVIREQPNPAQNQREQFMTYANAASDFGMDFIEAGIPLKLSIRMTVEAIARDHHDKASTSILAFARARERDIDIAYQSVSAAARHGISLLTSASDVQLKKFEMVRSEDVLGRRSKMLEEFCRQVAYAAAHKPHDLLVYLEDATRADRNYLRDLSQAYIESGATIISVPDTVGFISDPEDYADLIQDLRETVPGSEKVDWSAHAHEDRKLAVIMSLRAMKRRVVDIVEGTINGFGERCGNANLKDIIFNAHVSRGSSRYPDYCRSPRLKLQDLPRLHRLGNEALGVETSSHEPVVGKFARKTGAGMHQDGGLKDPDMFSGYDAAEFGVTDSDPFVFTDQSGSKGLRSILEHRGIALTGSELQTAFEDCDRMAALFHGRVEDSLLEAAAYEAGDLPRRFELKKYKIEDEETDQPTVSGILALDGEDVPFIGRGDGPTSAFVDGLGTVMKERLGMEIDVRKWFELAEIDESENGDAEPSASEPGREATVWGFARVRVNGDKLFGYARDPNATRASFLACLQAVNRWYTKNRAGVPAAALK